MSEPITVELSPSSKQQMKDVGQTNNPSPSRGQETESDALEKKRKGFFKLAMRSELEEVIKIYKVNLEVQGRRLTRAKGTTLHVAILAGKEDVTLRLLFRVSDENERNRHGETPLFTAVRHEKEEAFFALERWVQNVNPPKDVRKRDVTHCRREKDGNNILHFAILGEYFGLANEIIGLYPELINYVNKIGELPLHYLAKKPLCFKSVSL